MNSPVKFTTTDDFAVVRGFSFCGANFMIQSLEDIIEWPDGTMCFREELDQMTHMSDDYVVIYFDSPEYDQALLRM